MRISRACEVRVHPRDAADILIRRQRLAQGKQPRAEDHLCMQFGILKSGQGYWVRMMTACLIAVATLASAGWTYQQGSLIADRLPKSGYQVQVTLSGAAPAPDTKVEFFPRTDPQVIPSPIGTATIAVFEQGSGLTNFTNVAMNTGREIAEAGSIRHPTVAALPGGTVSDTAGDTIGTWGSNVPVQPVPMVDPQLVQGGLAATVLLVGTMLAFWLAGRREKTVDFLIATDFEMKKVNWSTPKEVIGATWVVIGAAVLISASLFAFDMTFRAFFKFIGILVG